jgi:ornithine carrier protein
MQTESGAGAGFLQTLRNIYSAQGLRGLYSGIGITLIRAVPANACIFYCYETTTRLIKSF